MTDINKPEQTTYWIAYNEDKSILQYGITNPDQETTIGQPFAETFTDKDTWLNRLAELNITPDLPDNN